MNSRGLQLVTAAREAFIRHGWNDDGVSVTFNTRMRVRLEKTDHRATIGPRTTNFYRLEPNGCADGPDRVIKDFVRCKTSDVFTIAKKAESLRHERDRR